MPKGNGSNQTDLGRGVTAKNCSEMYHLRWISSGKKSLCAEVSFFKNFIFRKLKPSTQHPNKNLIFFTGQLSAKNLIFSHYSIFKNSLSCRAVKIKTKALTQVKAKALTWVKALNWVKVRVLAETDVVKALTHKDFFPLYLAKGYNFILYIRA